MLRSVLTIAITTFAVVLLAVSGYVYRYPVGCFFQKKENLTDAVIVVRSCYGCNCHHYQIEVYWTGDVMLSMMNRESGLKVKTSKIPAEYAQRIIRKLHGEANFSCMSNIPVIHYPEDAPIYQISLSSHQWSRDLVVGGTHAYRMELESVVDDILKATEFKKFLREY